MLLVMDENIIILVVIMMIIQMDLLIIELLKIYPLLLKRRVVTYDSKYIFIEVKIERPFDDSDVRVDSYAVPHSLTHSYEFS